MYDIFRISNNAKLNMYNVNNNVNTEKKCSVECNAFVYATLENCNLFRINIEKANSWINDLGSLYIEKPTVQIDNCLIKDSVSNYYRKY